MNIRKWLKGENTHKKNYSALLFRLLEYIKIKLFSFELRWTIVDNSKISALMWNVFYKNFRI